VHWRAKSSTIQPWIVRLRSHLVQSSITSQPILYNRWRSKGWKSRSQRNVRYVSAEENAITQEPIGWQTSNLVWASLLLRRIMTGAKSGGLRLQYIAITIFCRSWILIDFEDQPFSSSRQIRFKCYRSGSSNYWILSAVLNNICIKELSRHRSLYRSVMTSLLRTECLGFYAYDITAVTRSPSSAPLLDEDEALKQLHIVIDMVNDIW